MNRIDLAMNERGEFVLPPKAATRVPEGYAGRSTENATAALELPAVNGAAAAENRIEPPKTIDEFYAIDKVRQLQWDEHVSRTCWQAARDIFWYKKKKGEWTQLPEKRLRQLLEKAEFFSHINGETKESEKSQRELYWKEFVTHIIDDREVKHVGELAGYAEGVHEIDGAKYLCTKGYKLIEPVKGEFQTIEKLLLQLFGDEQLGEQQLPYLHAWLRTAYKSLQKGEKSVGQVLVVARPVDIGKSFIKTHIIRPILGGRYIEPEAFLQGGDSV